MRSQTRSIAALLGSNFAAISAALALTTILGKQVYDLTGSELALGLLGLAEFAPNALLVLVTGTLADRFDRRRIASLSMVSQAAVVSMLALYAASSPTSIVPIFALVFAWGIARAFGWPALRALPADVVPPARLPWLTVRYSATFQAALIVGPVLGGTLYAFDVVAPFVMVAVLLVLGAAGMPLVAVHPVASRDEGPTSDAQLRADTAVEMVTEAATGETAVVSPRRVRLHEALEGFRFIRRQPVLLGAISLDLFAVLFGGAVALLPALAEKRLGVGAIGLGWLRAAIGIGAGAMTLVLAIRPLRRRVGTALFLAVAGFGFGTIVLGLARSFAVAFVALMVLAAADSVSVFIRSALVPLVTPVQLRGRVLAFETVFIGASNELGAFEAGVAGQLLGPAAAVVFGGVCTLAVAMIWIRWFPALRAVDRFPGHANGSG